MKNFRNYIVCLILTIVSILFVSCNEIIEVKARKLISKTEMSKEEYTLEIYPGSKAEFTFATFKGKEEGYPIYKMSNNKKYKYYINVDGTYYFFNLKE